MTATVLLSLFPGYSDLVSLWGSPFPSTTGSTQAAPSQCWIPWSWQRNCVRAEKRGSIFSTLLCCESNWGEIQKVGRGKQRLPLLYPQIITRSGSTLKDLVLCTHSCFTGCFCKGFKDNCQYPFVLKQWSNLWLSHSVLGFDLCHLFVSHCCSPSVRCMLLGPS